VNAGGPTDGAERLRRPPDVPGLFADVASIGPFFAVATGAPPPGGGWVPLRALHGDGLFPDAPVRDGHPLRARIASIGAALGVGERVAASTAFQGLAAQLVAPLFAAAVGGALPRPAESDTLATTLHWRPGGNGPWLWWSGTAGQIVDCPDPAAAALDGVLVGVLAPLVAAVRAQVPISQRVLWGNAASAVASARRLVAAARPAAAERATTVAESLLAAPPLAPTATLRAPEPPDVRWTFRRRSCCLYYRVPGAAVCGDCVLLDRRPTSSRPARA
jgi:hypothetical protein